MKESKQAPTPRLSDSLEGLPALIVLLSIEPVTFLFPKGERNSVSFTAPGLMLVGIAFVLIGYCGFVGLDSYGG